MQIDVGDLVNHYPTENVGQNEIKIPSLWIAQSIWIEAKWSFFLKYIIPTLYTKDMQGFDESQLHIILRVKPQKRYLT